MPQVSTEHYEHENYDELHRWVSYWYQVQAVQRCRPKTVLEIGKGSGVLSWYLKERLGLDVTTVDFDASLEPDQVVDVRELSDHFEADQFDVVCAFQVLEHLPFSDFEPSLRQISAVTRRHAIISLPNFGFFFQFRFHIWRYKFAFGRKIRRPHEWKFDGEHHWEVGTNGHEPRVVRRAIQSVMTLEDEYPFTDYPYHNCYVLRKE